MQFDDTVTQDPSLASLLKSFIDGGRSMPAVVAEGAIVNQTTIGQYATSPAAVRRFITNSWIQQRPLNAGLVQQTTSTGAAITHTYTPNNSTFPGLWDQKIYAVLTEVDFSATVSKGIVDVTAAGFGAFEQTISIQAVTGQPLSSKSGAAKVRVWTFPGETFAGAAQYTPFSFRPALGGAGDPLVNAHNLVMTIAAGLPTGAVVTTTLLTRGQPDVDTLATLMAQADHRAISAVAKNLR